jgi:hypothetical protein
MTNPICPVPWCMSDHSDHDDTHWTLPEVFDTLGEHAPLMLTEVRIQGSLVPGEVRPARVHVDTRIASDLWTAALVLSPNQARHLSARVVETAEIVDPRDESR